MREPPADLSDRALSASLGERYGLSVAALTFLPLGHDSSAWVYRVETADATPYFLKVRREVANPASLLVPRYLHDRGVARVVAPLPTNVGTLWTDVDDYALILYPFVAGTTGKDQGMTPRQWTDYGEILRRIHDAAVEPDLARIMRRETFAPSGVDQIRALATHIAEETDAGSQAGVLTAFWNQQRDAIRAVVDRAEDLGPRVARTDLPFVLCHADIHTANVLLDADGQVWIVDWDETVLAPKERDLMFVVGGGISRDLVGPREENLFLQGYGAAALDPLALAYYRYAWAVSDIGAYGEQVFFRPDLGEVTRRAAVDLFKSLFRPGAIVDLALSHPPRRVP